LDLEVCEVKLAEE
jgi:hypothetical protein